ncbi:MAG: hydroxyacylglutathione hydrolase [Gammaproteobacteria bacterium]|nr:MAG: hydroxyacylglutathione hydrolase [Gammaproteobacteria bacterium]
MLTIHAITAFDDNYIWFIQAENSTGVLIVDPGDAAPAIEAIKKLKLDPVAILITHGCHDHVDGIAELLSHYELPVYGPSNEFIPHLSHALTQGDTFTISDEFPEINVLDIPGHTRGHIGFVIEDKLFCGDTLFAAGCGRTHGGQPEVLFTSLEKIANLPEQTQIYCAHEYTAANLRFAETVEPNNSHIQQRIIDTKSLRQQAKPTIPFSLALELKTNPFLRCGEVEVVKAAEQQLGERVNSKAATFRTLRAWKDRF